MGKRVEEPWGERGCGDGAITVTGMVGLFLGMVGVFWGIGAGI